MSAIGHGVTIARTDVRRATRKYRTKWYQGLFTVVFVLGATGAAGWAGYVFGPLLVEGLPAEVPFTPLDAVHGVFAVVWLVGVVVFGIRAIGQRGTLVNGEGILTMVPTRDAVVGLLAAEALYVLLWVVPVGFGLGVGLVSSTGSYAAVATAPLALALAGVTAALVGYPLGLAIRHVATRFAFVARHKNAVIALVFLIYMVLVFTNTLNEAVVALFEPMQAAPQGWFGDLLLVGVAGVGASLAFAGAAVALSAVVAVVSVAATTAVAGRHWFADPVLAGEVEEPGAAYDGEYAPGPIDAALSRAFGRPTAAVITQSWRRAARAPMKLLYAFYPAFFLLGVVAEIYQSGVVPSYLPYLILAFVAWAGAVIFTLNPLGDQGAVLPTTVLSKVRGRDFVLAHLVAGLVVAIPVGTVLTGALAYLSPLDDGSVVLLTVAAPVVMVLASLVAVGLGVAFPRYEAVTVTQSMKAVIPSAWAFVFFSLYLIGTTIVGAVVAQGFVRALAAGLLTWALPFGLGIDAATLYYVAVVALVVLVSLPLASYRYAVGKYERFTVA